MHQKIPVPLSMLADALFHHGNVLKRKRNVLISYSMMQYGEARHRNSSCQAIITAYLVNNNSFKTSE
jgi:hypothetical protein